MAELSLAGWLLLAFTLQRALVARERVLRACHEVRGPLTAAGLALRLVDGPHAVAIDEQLRRARLALEDLVPARGTCDRIERIPVAALLVTTHMTWAPVCAALGRTLAVGAAPPGLSVLADRTRLAQAIGNLIANALEHGEGTIEVRPRVLGGALRLEVRDGGGGLDRPLARVMRPRGGGRGRGLAISSEIAARCGGRLSTAPGGALVLELPAMEAA